MSKVVNKKLARRVVPQRLKVSLRPQPKFFSTLLVVVAIILVWRGLWNLVDVYLFPHYPMLSNIVGLIIGLLMLYLPDEDIKELV